jgi:hypothetical protein
MKWKNVKNVILLGIYILDPEIVEIFRVLGKSFNNMFELFLKH